MTFTKSEKKEMQIWYAQIESIRENVNSKCNFLMNRLQYILDGDVEWAKQTKK